MKLSSETFAILKNFGIINQGIHFKPGNVIKTISPQKTIQAQAEILEDMPIDFGIYDLNNFLSVVSLHKDEPTFEFDSHHVVIIGNNSRSKIKYRFCDPSMIVTPPDKNLVMPTSEVQFKLTYEDFLWILKAAAVLSSPQVSIQSDGGKIYIVTLDVANDSAHTDSLEIAEGNGNSFNMIFRTENLTKLLPGTYDVSISSQGLSNFIGDKNKLQYFVAIEKGSTFG